MGTVRDRPNNEKTLISRECAKSGSHFSGNFGPRWGGQGALGTFLDDILFTGAFFIATNIAWRAEQEAGKRGQQLFASGIWTVIRKIGVWSYSIYLTHIITFTAVKQIMLTLKFSPGLVLVFRFSLGLAAGLVFYAVIERYWHKRARLVIARMRP